MRPDQLEVHPGAIMECCPIRGRDITAADIADSSGGQPSQFLQNPLGISHTPYSNQTTSNDFPSPAQNRKIMKQMKPRNRAEYRLRRSQGNKI